MLFVEKYSVGFEHADLEASGEEVEGGTPAAQSPCHEQWLITILVSSYIPPLAVTDAGCGTGSW